MNTPRKQPAITPPLGPEAAVAISHRKAGRHKDRRRVKRSDVKAALRRECEE